MLALMLVGAADSVSTIIRNTIRQLQTPDHIRGRMTSINQIFFQGGPQLGEVEAGLSGPILRAVPRGHQRRDGLSAGCWVDRAPLASVKRLQRR